MNMDEAYSNRKHIPGGDLYPARWAADAATFRAAMGARARLGLAYGSGARQRFDLFLPDGPPRGLLVFIHGGYWHMFGRQDWSHLAAGGVARGWAVAMLGYTLAPETRIAGITRGVAVGLVFAAREAAQLNDTGPVVVTGHSAGGHLAARMACDDVALPMAGRLRRVVPISPVSDLEPLMQTAMNADLRIDAAEAAAESPVRHSLRPGVSAHVWVGADERPVFLDQARWLGTAWNVPVTVEPGRHHFDVIEGLLRPDSALMQVLLA